MTGPGSPPRQLPSATGLPLPRGDGRLMSLDLQNCTDGFLALNLIRTTRVCEARAAAGDGNDPPHNAAGKRLHRAKTLVLCSSHRTAASRAHGNDDDGDDDDDDDEDDDLQWANRRTPLQSVPQRSGHDDGKIVHKANKTTGKENKVSFPRKPASSPMAIARQQHSGPIRAHSGPFSGPLAPCTKRFSIRKPSIIPTNLRCREAPELIRPCEPMSPEVTCLGCIKNKEFDSECAAYTTDDTEPSIDSQSTEGFNTKNQLCGKRRKGRKKKDKVRCLSRRRFAAAGLRNTHSPACSEHVQTRRERAATLARSLTDLLEDMRQADKKNAHYAPSVPPPNSLLLMKGCTTSREMDMDAGSDKHGITMGSQGGLNKTSRNSLLLTTRGCRTRNKDIDMDVCSGDHVAKDDGVDVVSEDEPSVPPRNSLLLMRGCKIRGNWALPRELLLMDRPSLRPKQGPLAPMDSITAPVHKSDTKADHEQKPKARKSQHFSLLDLIIKEENMMGEVFSTSGAQYGIATHGSNTIALDAKSSVGIEHCEEVVSKFLQVEPTQECQRRPTLCQRRSLDLPPIEVKLCKQLER